MPHRRYSLQSLCNFIVKHENYVDDTIPVITILGYRLSGLAHLGDAACAGLAQVAYYRYRCTEFCDAIPEFPSRL